MIEKESEQITKNAIRQQRTYHIKKECFYYKLLCLSFVFLTSPLPLLSYFISLLVSPLRSLSLILFSSRFFFALHFSSLLFSPLLSSSQSVLKSLSISFVLSSISSLCRSTSLSIRDTISKWVTHSILTVSYFWSWFSIHILSYYLARSLSPSLIPSTLLLLLSLCLSLSLTHYLSLSHTPSILLSPQATPLACLIRHMGWLSQSQFMYDQIRTSCLINKKVVDERKWKKCAWKTWESLQERNAQRKRNDAKEETLMIIVKITRQARMYQIRW